MDAGLMPTMTVHSQPEDRVPAGEFLGNFVLAKKRGPLVILCFPKKKRWLDLSGFPKKEGKLKKCSPFVTVCALFCKCIIRMKVNGLFVLYNCMQNLLEFMTDI